MESLRNSLQRSRESAMKKPRLAEDQRNDLGTGGAYHPQPLQQSQELVNQYKTALSELTFNSKPIITNLTIIAGESVLHAKAIAAVVCNNIIEVPSEQKLPSLYLLDSIVKNIGVPYAKHFAPRLPEVFCKAYRQVDPPIQSSMRHLFGTWRSVFPPHIRQMIERELEFSSAANGSSFGTVISKSDAQSQLSQHSIHVNPKYLERQQLLQQAGRRHEKPWHGVAGGVAGKPYDPQNEYRMKHRMPDHLIPKSIEAVYLQPTLNIAQRRGNNISTSWKNSEEEEFTWDNSRLPDQDAEKMGTTNLIRRPHIAHAAVPRFDRESSSDSLSTEHSDRANLGNNSSSPWRRQEATSMEDLTFSDSAANSSYAEGKLAMEDGLPSKIPAGARAGPPYLGASGVGVSAHASLNPTRTTSQQRFPSIGDAPPSQQSSRQPFPSTSFPWRDPPRQLPISADQDYSSVLPRSQLKVQSSRSLLSQNVQLRDPNRLPPEELPSSSLAVASGELVRHYPFSHEQQLNDELSESSGPFGKQTPPFKGNAGASLPSGISEVDKLNRHTTETSVHLTTSDLLAAVLKSGGLSDVSTGGLASKSLQDAKFANSRDAAASAKSSASIISRKKEELLQLSPVPSSPLTQTLKVTDKVSNPLSSLLSSLLVKGLIKSEVLQVSSCEMTIQPENREKSIIAPKSEPISSAEEASPGKFDAKSSVEFPKSTLVTEKLDAKDSSIQPQPTPVKTECLIGLKFKSDVIRGFHPAVINSLFDDLPHQCNICGFRLKLKGWLDKHLEWHGKKKIGPDGVRRGTRKWYAHIEDWISPKPSIPFVLDSSYKDDSWRAAIKRDDPMAPAEEDQCICVQCGELFEDCYIPEGNRWMFKGAVPTIFPSGNGEQLYSSNSHIGPLVHLRCRSEGSANELGLVKRVKMET